MVTLFLVDNFIKYGLKSSVEKSVDFLGVNELIFGVLKVVVIYVFYGLSPLGFWGLWFFTLGFLGVLVFSLFEYYLNNLRGL